jgi:hypothetical protein
MHAYMHTYIHTYTFRVAMADGGAAVAEIEMVRVDIVDGAGAHPSPSRLSTRHWPSSSASALRPPVTPPCLGAASAPRPTCSESGSEYNIQHGLGGTAYTTCHVSCCPRSRAVSRRPFRVWQRGRGAAPHRSHPPSYCRAPATVPSASPRDGRGLAPATSASGLGLTPATYASGLGLTPATYASGLGLTPATYASRLGLTPATSASGLGVPLRHLHRDWARSRGGARAGNRWCAQDVGARCSGCR